MFSCSGLVLPIQSTTVWSLHSTHGVHGGGKGGLTDGFTQGYKNPSVPIQLASLSQISPNLSRAYKNPGSPVSGTRLDSKQY